MDVAAERSVGAVEEVSGRLRRVLLVGDYGDERESLRVTDLPGAVLGSILAHLEDPVDVMSALCICRLFRVVVGTAPFRLRLRHRQLDETLVTTRDDAPAGSLRVAAQTLGSWTRAALGSIRTHMCATRELDLAGCFIEDDDLVGVVADLRCLERLILDNCQKLTGAVADMLAASVTSGPCCVSLQRCFGMGSSSIGSLLVASAAHGSRMRSMLLSHLDSLDIPQSDLNVHMRDYECERESARGVDIDIAKSVGSISPGSGLRILALNNCARLAISDFLSVAMLCPCLELLCLGGSVQGLESIRVEDVSQDSISSTASALVGVIELLPRLRVLELTFCAPAVVQVVREHVIEKIQIWDFCEESSLSAAAWVLNGQEMFGNAGGGKSAALLHFPQDEGRWGSFQEDAAFGLRGAANCSDVRKRTPLHVAAACGDVRMITGLLAIGAMAFGMKDSSGSSALFVAAESGYAQACELLLQGGADVLAGNRAGETPLYIAALRGHSLAVGIMLAHCHERGVNWEDADVYGDGWTPLMAAVVADRRHVGEMLLAATGFQSETDQPLVTSVSQDPGKAKDPEVARLVDVSHATSDILPSTFKPVQVDGLESETSSETGSTSRQLRRLLNRQNRYGQTALHIAAQKGSVWFIERLLSAGASVEVPNDYGYRAVDVAKRYKHTEIAGMLREWESIRRKEAPVSKRKKSARKARRNKDKATTRVATPDDVVPEPSSDCREADDGHNTDHPGLGEVTQPSAFVPDQLGQPDTLTDWHTIFEAS